MVFALIGQRSIERRGRTWLRSWCQISPREIARQLKVSTNLVHEALDSPYVERSEKGCRVRMTSGSERWAPLPFGPLGGPDDAPAMSAREYLLLSVQLHRELADAKPLDCTQLAELTRTSSGRCVSPSTVAKSLRSLHERGWIAAELAQPMRAASEPCDAEISMRTFNTPSAQHIPAKPQMGAHVSPESASPLRQHPRDPYSSSALSSRFEGGTAGPVRAEGAAYLTRARGERGIDPPEYPGVAAVRSVFGPEIGGKVASLGLGRSANRWIENEIRTGTPAERLCFRVGAAVLRLSTGELYLRPGADGMVRFLRFALTRPQGCGDLGCEDGVQWDYQRKCAGDPCSACRERRLALADAKRAPRSSPERCAEPPGGNAPPRSPEAARIALRGRACCRECEVPFADGRGPADGVCRECRSMC